MISMLIESKFMRIQGAAFSVYVLPDCNNQLMFSSHVIYSAKYCPNVLEKEPTNTTTSINMMMLAVRQACH